ncbi:MAG TPA: hypothetical protein DCZ11_02360, partial [Gammaproteobacteria bacterium]|nr:hypothetical protein [Gammaproteobacteria bacterium]MCH77267.1 hypothetical protein [Gammaproteobacteria bacterium]
GAARLARALQGIVCVEAGMLFFVAQDAMMKTMLGEFTVWTLIFARSIVTLLVLMLLIYAHQLLRGGGG